MKARVLAILRYAALVLIATILLLPIYWLIMSSFRPAEDIFRYAGQFSLETLVPKRLTLENFQQIFAASFPRALFNSLFVSIATVLLGVFVNSMAGFAFAVFDFRFKKALFVAVLLSFMMPFESIVIPLYTLMRTLRWTDTYAALILPEVAGGLVIFLFRQFFAGIPKEIYEAARLDGASWWRIYLQMTMPLSGPTIATASLMMFIHQWDAFFWPLVATSSSDLAVVQVAIARNMTLEQANWGALFASASTAVIVAAVPFFILQRSYVRVVAVQADK
jgi:ABC-type glycerol-3-phosphate transport system permease component